MCVYYHIDNSLVKFGNGIDGESASKFWVCYVTISGDGNTVDVGDYGHNENGSISGKVKVYSNPKYKIK